MSDPSHLSSAKPTASQTVEEPLDLIRLSLDEDVLVKCKGNRELHGKLHAYDAHLNLVLGNVEEIYQHIQIGEETGEEMIQEQRRKIELLFVRGDSVILVSPPVKTT